VKPQDAWNAALNQLEIQLDRANFDTWLRDAQFQSFEAPATFVICVRNSFARDNLQHRLYRSICRVLRDVFGSPVDLRFEVRKVDSPAPKDEADDDMPLFQYMAHREPSAVPAPLHERVASPQRPDLPEYQLNPRFTFDRYVAGSANHMLYAAAAAVAENPAQVYNPFLVYGGVGLGKTHLLQAIAHNCRMRGLSVIYIPSEAFINDLVSAIRQRTTAMFREKYRSVDLLLVDDIQFIAGKESTQDEFFHTFNALYTFNKQIVLASDRHPRRLELLEDRLRSRFEGGLVMDIQLPEFEARVAILESWASERGLRMPRSVCETIAERARSNIRELEGLFTQVVAKTQLGHQVLTHASAERIVEQYDRPRRQHQPKITLEQVVQLTADHFNLSKKDLTGKRRTGRINHTRQIAMYLAREITEASLPQIGDAFGGRSHTTVLHGYNKVAEMMEGDDSFRYELLALQERIVQGDAGVGGSA
jgi:chromosomal replication initiator protein